jgi:dienelactone hydrolase
MNRQEETNPLSDYELRTLPGLWQWADQTPRQLAFKAQTRREAEVWQRELRDKLIELLGGFPPGRCDLDPHPIETVEDAAFTREQVVIQTQPGEYMPVHVLHPRNATPPYKPVIAVHGHGSDGARLLLGDAHDPLEVEHMHALNYDYARRLAEHGFLVFVPVLRGFAERLEDPPLQDTDEGLWVKSCHTAGMGALLCGKTLLGLRVWDVKRLVDYIQTRPEPTTTGLGCAGLSGGGTVTLFTTALEPRITCAAVSGYFNTFRDSIMAIRHCACNYVPGILRYAELVDVAGLIAPRPLLVESGRQDPIFPVSAAQRAYRDLQTIYHTFEADDHTKAVLFDGEHAWYGAETYAWLDRWLSVGEG